MKIIDFSKPGRGLTKKEIAEYENKNPVKRFFEILFDKYFKIWELSFLIILFSLPIITIPSVLISASKISRKFVAWEPVFLLEEFWDGFKKNLIKGFIIFLIAFPVSFMLIITFFYYYSPETIFIVIIETVAAAAFFAAHFYVIQQIAVLELSLFTVYKNALIMLFVIPVRTFFLVFFTLLCIYLMWLFPLALIIFPLIGIFGLISYVNAFMTYKPFKKLLIEPFYKEHPEFLKENSLEQEEIEYDEETPDEQYADTGENDDDSPVFSDSRYAGGEIEVKLPDKKDDKLKKRRVIS